MTRYRPLVLALLALLTQIGALSPEVSAEIEKHADAIITGILAAWSLIAFLRNRRASTYAQEGRKT